MKVTREIKLKDPKYCDICPCRELLCASYLGHEVYMCALGYNEWSVATQPAIEWSPRFKHLLRPKKCIEENGL